LIPPPRPLCKVNFDAVVFNEDRKAGVGVVIRNYLGQIMASMTEKCNLPTLVDEVEAMAVVRAVVFAQELRFSSNILEGDSKKIMNTFKNDEPAFASYGHLIEEAKFLAESFVVFSVSHVKRQSNSVAHNLARYARHISDLSVWIESVSSHLNAVTLADSVV